jgi:hypothetical protein
MTTNQAQIIPVGAHRYAITLREDDELVQLVLHADQATVALIASDNLDEPRLVKDTLTYLLQRQRADELPPVLDLADVAAGYDTWLEDMRTQLDTASGQRPGQARP